MTLREIERFREALEHTDEENAHLSPHLQEAMRDSLNAQMADLLTEIAEYERRLTTPASGSEPSQERPPRRSVSR